RLRIERVNVPEGATTMPLPAIENGEKLIAAFVGGQQVDAGQGGKIRLPEGLSGSDVLMVFIASRTGQQVKRAAVGAEGFVLDHYDRTAITDHLRSVADPLLKAFGDTPPHSVFSDSLEVYDSDWTSNFIEEFRQRRGYDLTPHLPELADEIGLHSQAVRHDWAKTLTELAEDNYLKPIREWAHAHGTLFRSQTYGEPPVILSSNADVDLPEGEHGPLWRRFSAARWASSASHLYGVPVTSTETWTWLHSPVFRATPLDLKAEADRHFIEGINQLIGHGWPYSPPSAGEPGWRFYAAAALNDHNPWFQVMPELTRYLQRVSFLMRQGKPANDIAIYVPTDDAWAHLKPGKVAVDEMADTLLGPVLMPEVLNAGYNFDFIDDRAIAAAGVPYKLLILPGVERIPLGTLQRLQNYASQGGLLIATRSLPSLAPGLIEEKTDTTRIIEIARQLFATGSKNARLIEQEQNVASALREMVDPDLATGSAGPAIGFVHRKLSSAEIYFLVNSSNHAVETEASIRVSGMQPEWWDAFTGEVTPAEYRASANRTEIELKLAPYESRVLVFSKANGLSARAGRTTAHQQAIDLSSDWTVIFTGTGRQIHMAHLLSWTSDGETRFYSGLAVYEKSFHLPQTFTAGEKTVLDFGPGTPVEPGLRIAPGMHALLESPVRESAVIFANGKRAGDVWHPPYELDVTRYLHAGENALRIVVGNLAINEMAGQPLPDYRLLDLRYGERFVPQDMQEVRPLPSGILGPVKLLYFADSIANANRVSPAATTRY
ncbi:MAG: glycoside hydrolase, partial [Acidobacteriota bacterium]|nr:glycoside hydrolase [Acidobacteriota bacterium]